MRTCETVGTWYDGVRTRAVIKRFDAPRPEDGCQYELTVYNQADTLMVTADLTQTITRMMEAEIREGSKSYLLACQRAGVEPAATSAPTWWERIRTAIGLSANQGKGTQ